MFIDVLFITQIQWNYQNILFFKEQIYFFLYINQNLIFILRKKYKISFNETLKILHFKYILLNNNTNDLKLRSNILNSKFITFHLLNKYYFLSIFF